MINTKIITDKKGITLVELLVVISIIGILAVIGVPEYGRFVAKESVRRAAGDLLQNMRLARTMAIKENVPYVVAFSLAQPTNYSIGYDTNGDGVPEGYEGGIGNVRVINIQSEYGANVALGSGNFTTTPPNGPGGVAIADAAFFTFNPDGSAGPAGITYIQHSSADRGYTFCVELANTAGMTNLFMWDGEAGDASNTGWTEIR